MKTTPVIFLLAFTFLFLFSGSSVVFGNDLQDALDAANKGNAEAQNKLGRMYARGEGVPQDYKEAVKWYRLSAEQGLASAQIQLGEMYTNGQGVPQGDKEAVKWTRLAAEQGNAQAQLNLDELKKMLSVQCTSKIDSLKRLTCYESLPEGSKKQECLSEKDSLKKLVCYDQSIVESQCATETDSLKRLTCYDGFPDNFKDEKCSSMSDSLKRLSCFDKYWSIGKFIKELLNHSK